MDINDQGLKWLLIFMYKQFPYQFYNTLIARTVAAPMVRFDPSSICLGQFIPDGLAAAQLEWFPEGWHETCLVSYASPNHNHQPANTMPSEAKHFPVTVIMESRPSNSVWQDVSWDAVGVCSSANTSPEADKLIDAKIIKRGEIEQVIYDNLILRLFFDECESYYHNLMSPKPGCFVIAREDDEGRPVPFLVSMSFDEAHAYQEGDDLVYAVPIPVELYRWLEAYVIDNYAPMKRRKRKRTNWKADK